MILLFISFLAGVLTILAPCTLPLLPVIIGSSVSGNETDPKSLRRPLTIAASLGLSVILFTLALKVSTLFIAVPASVWSFISGSIIFLFGLVSLFPSLWETIPFTAKLNLESNKLIGVGYKKKSFWGDVIIGAALGPVFSTCSPTYFIILATVLPQSFFLGLLDLVAYAIGLSGVLLLVAFLGQRLVSRLGGVSDTHGWFKRGIGLLFVCIGIVVILGYDKQAETALLQRGLFDITVLEQKLLRLNDPVDSTLAGKSAPGALAAPEFVSPDGYINTNGQPITLADLKGKKVVLLDIWTYSCINCQRTIPYLNAWYKKYKTQGLEIVGIHTPEFSFEKVQANVEAAVKRLGIEYPVILDNEYQTWRAYQNEYWPRKYLISVDGAIIYDHVGEGGYEDTERAIQKALIELNEKSGTSSRITVPLDITTPTDVVSMDGNSVRSPEVYFGASRNEFLANGQPGLAGVQTFTLPSGAIIPNALYLGGKWNLVPEKATAQGHATIRFRYNAKNVYMVASSALPAGVTVTIRRDGVVVSKMTIKEERLYPLIEGNSYGDHVLEIDIPEGGLDAYTFTFG